MFHFRKRKKMCNPYLKKVPQERYIPFKKISIREAVEMILNKNITNTTIIDVRTKREYNVAHIKGAINIDVNDLNNNTYNLDYNSKILLYCNSGAKAIKAAYLLSYIGYNRIYIWEGGSIHSMIKYNLVV